jgi:PhnB protein
MEMATYLTFDGRCREAFAFYEKCLGGKIAAMMTHAQTPAAAHVPAEWGEKIIHARMTVGGQTLMGSDAPPDRYEPAKGFSVMLGVDDAATAERMFHDLAEGGQVRMPIDKTFWAERFGMLTDRFGIPWMVNCEAKPG